MRLIKSIVMLSILMFIQIAHAESGFKGSIQPIPTEILNKMKGHIWHKGCPLPFSSMRYLTVTYWGFDDRSHEGHLIILKTLAAEVIDIFQELYEMKIPIEKMQLPDIYSTGNNDWSAIDWKQSEDNNTSGFLCREDDQSPGQYSPHSYGIALDINPKYNPSKIAYNKIQPISGKSYFDRSKNHKGMFDGKIADVFAKHGWKWGGYWPADKIDYMHFQKDMDAHYMCPVLIPIDHEQLPLEK